MDRSKDDLNPLEVKFTGLSVREARIMEQILISAYTLDNLLNMRREIARNKLALFTGSFINIIRIFGGAVEDEYLNLMGR